MMNKEIILKLLAEACQSDFDTLKTSNEKDDLTSIGLTSVSFISFIVKLEEEFNIEINDSDLLMENFNTLEALYNTISTYLLFNHGSKTLKKCLILDCDNVLWKGISGEEPIIVDKDVLNFHKVIDDLRKRGVILCLCSKNQPEIINNVFSNMTLGIDKDFFVLSKINKLDKATNIREIAASLNIDISSFVFADDSDYELGYVSLNMPEITTIKVDYNDLSFIDKIYDAFSNTPNTSIDRTQIYREQKAREKEKIFFVSIDDYNKSLKTEISCHIAEPTEIPRLSELSMRSNQFNLSNTHYSKDDIYAFFNANNCQILSLSAKDKYGDMGLVGFAIVFNDIIESFILSCRVFGRGFENVLMNKIKSISPCVKGIYRNNGKNTLYAHFYLDNGIEII